MKKRAVIYILRSGLKHYRPPEEGEKLFYWDPKQKILYPKNESITGFNQYILVDSNITTGKTVRETIACLGLPREKVKIRGNPKTELAKKIVDQPMSNGDPDPEKAMLVFAGPAASLKTFLARGLEMTQGIPVIQCGKELQKLTDVGKYGEKLMQKENQNPFIVGELLYPIVQKYTSEKVIILDGPKSVETVLFLSYATHRPVFVFYVYNSDELRQNAIALRTDPDDLYATERDRLFQAGLNRLREEAYAVIDIAEWRTLQLLAEVLELLGYKVSSIAGLPNPFGSKRPILELYRRNVEKLVKKNTVINRDFSELMFHRSYIERLEKHGISLTSKQAEIVALTASAFRIIDDILDEHTIRDDAPAFWTKHGIVRSIYIATLMTVKAWNLSAQLGVGERFLEMFQKCVDAVMYELKIEDGIEKFETFEDWLRAAEREAAFREYLAYLIGKPEKAKEFRAWALHAQAKDDLMGAEKGGREDTDRRLNRPLFKPEWQSKLPPRPDI